MTATGLATLNGGLTISRTNDSNDNIFYSTGSSSSSSYITSISQDGGTIELRGEYPHPSGSGTYEHSYIRLTNDDIIDDITLYSYNSGSGSAEISLDATNGITLTGKTTVSGTLSNGVIKISEGYISVQSNTTMSYIDISDLGTLRFSSSSGSAYLQGSSGASPELLMYVGDSSSNKCYASLYTPLSGGLLFNSSTLSGSLTFFPFSGSTLYAKAYGSSNSFYSGVFSNFDASKSIKFKNAVFLITDNSNSSTVSNSLTTYCASSIPTTDSWSSNSSTLSASNIRIGFLTMNYVNSYTKITLIYLNSSGTWVSNSIISGASSTVIYFKFVCANCTLNRIA